MSKALFFALFTLSLTAAATAQELSGYTLQKGDVFTVEQQSQQTVFQELGETDHQLTNRVTAILEFQVREVRDSTFLLQVRFRDLFFKIESSSQGQLLNIRAREPGRSDLHSRLFGRLIDVPVSLEITRSGKVRSVSGGDDLVDGMLAGSGLNPGPGRTAIRESLLGDYSSEALAASFEQLTYFYPDRRVRSGSRWKNRHGGKLEAANTWTLDTLVGGSAIISGQASISMQGPPDSPGSILQGQQQMQVETEAGSGFVSKMVVSGTASGKTPLGATGTDPVPTRLEMKSTYTLIDHKHVQ